MTLVAPESKDHIPALREELRKRHVVRATTLMARKDGSTFQVAWSAAPIVDAAGRVTDIVSVIRDVTEDVRLREQLVRSERMSAIGELVCGVAHEINNPLQSVIGTVELLLAESHETRVRDDLQRAKFEAGRAGRIIRNLLAFVRRSPGERMLTELNEIVQSVVTVREEELAQSHIDVRQTYGTNLPLVLANREEIQQVISNLVMNAQHAMVHAHGRGTLSIRTFAVADQAVLELQDDGPGVAPEVAPRIRAVRDDECGRHRHRSWPVGGIRDSHVRWHVGVDTDPSWRLFPSHAARRRIRGSGSRISRSGSETTRPRMECCACPRRRHPGAARTPIGRRGSFRDLHRRSSARLRHARRSSAPG
jgi:PAS domain-containing protein